MKLLDKVTELKGVGPKKSEALEKLNIHTIEDLILFFPRDYENRKNKVNISELDIDKPAVIKGKVDLLVSDRYKYGRKQLLRLLVSDDTGSIEVVFFNAKYLMSSFKKGNEYIFYGKPQLNFGKLQMVHPEFSRVDDAAEGILPIYPLTKGITQKEMRQWQKTAGELYETAEDYLTGDILDRNRLCSLSYALKNIHFPTEKQKLLEAKYRLVFDELLTLQTGLFAARQNIKNEENGIAFPKTSDTTPYIESLPYPLTRAQARCVEEIEADLESGKVMNRLVQGDVGSGKTAVAEIAMYKAVKSGYQAALMAPTEILARQHYEGVGKSFEKHGIKVGFLSGSMKAAEKRETLEGLKSGELQVIVGTHAIIQPDVEFKDLGLVITDEQHRFGVGQRVRLKEKGRNPNILVMTATPIPRTLAVILYGDLDVSVIDELPPGRQKIQTRTIGQEMRDKCYDFVEKQLDAGRQAYVVTPLIEDSDVMDVRSADNVAQELSSRFKNHKTALLHGAMKQSEKDDIMADFYEGKIDILVATVVIEVGINVPNASVIVVENAERFGLAQLHQLRGRVGRGTHKSYCFLIMDGSSEVAKKRGEIMDSSSDGFYIAEEDLKLRGPGEIFGTRQHGLPDLNIADLARHLDVLEHAKREARAILEQDPALKAPENQGIRRRVTKLFGETMSLDL
ncbi:MAG: ATP-dependent DNA helicase RecG [Bacillota bacterium]|nr:ATP-dependent DNA helicase RecG [Bacillota bacterium]